MKWRSDEVKTSRAPSMEFWWLLLLFFDTSLANCYFRKHKFCFQSRTEWAPSTSCLWRENIRFFFPPRGDPKCFYGFMRRLVYLRGSFWRICLSCWKNPNLLHSPMESSPSAIGGLDPVLENCDVAVPHPKDAMIMNLGWNTSWFWLVSIKIRQHLWLHIDDSSWNSQMMNH